MTTRRRFRHPTRGGRHLRVADPDWRRPLDGRHSLELGGRWNAPGSFPVVYLFSTRELARSLVLARFGGRPYGVTDLRPGRRPVLVETDVPEHHAVDVVTDAGCRAAGLPVTYPRDADGAIVAHERCRPIGATAWEQGDQSIACRSATAKRGEPGEELAWFQRDRRLRVARRRTFEEWFTVLRKRDTALEAPPA